MKPQEISLSLERFEAGKRFIHFYNCSGGTFEITEIKTKASKAYHLPDRGRTLTFFQKSDPFLINLPVKLLDRGMPTLTNQQLARSIFHVATENGRKIKGVTLPGSGAKMTNENHP